MTTADIGLMAVVAYAVAFISQVAYSKKIYWRTFLLIATCAAIVCHGIQLHRLIDMPLGQNLSWVNSLSLLTWLSALLILLANFLLPVSSLNLFLYPGSIVTISLTIFLHPRYLVITQYHPHMLMHVLLATFLVALLIICAIQSFMLVLQQFCLKQKKFLSLLTLMPPLQVMQRLLFIEILLSFVSLTLFLLLTVFSTHFSTLESFWHEGIWSLVLWLIFLILLIGRYQLKWRSESGAVWASLGVGVALLIYLTSHLTH